MMPWAKVATTSAAEPDAVACGRPRARPARRHARAARDLATALACGGAGVAALSTACAGRHLARPGPAPAIALAVADPRAWPPNWQDPSPHTSHRMDVGGVGVQYLDWGGRGPLLVLLPGFGLNPHVFDDLAPRLTDRFRVVAMAPRGVAGSDAPDTGYTLAGVAEDVRVLIDRLGADRAVLGAHSIGGVAVTHFAARYPDRLRGLVYIDASPEDWTGGTAAAGSGPVPRPALLPDSATSDDAYRRYMATYLYGTWTPALEAQLRTYVTGYDGERRRFLVKQYADDATARPATLRALRGVRVPVLAICAIPGMRDRYPWLLPESATYRDARRYVERSLQPAARALGDVFEATVPTARVVRIPGSHFLFITDPGRVAREIRQWLTTEELKP